MKKRQWIVMLALALVTMSGCESEGPAGEQVVPTRSSPSSEREIIVTDTRADLPPGCGPRAAAEHLLRFTTAWASGNRQTLSEVFEQEPDFRLVADGSSGEDGRKESAASDRSGLEDYFIERHERESTLDLTLVKVWPSIRDPGIIDPVILVSFAGKLASKDGDGKAYSGSAKLVCPGGRIYTLRMGPGPLYFEVSKPSCPNPPKREEKAGALVSCAGEGGPF